MKKSLVARGFTGIVASLLGVSAVGCGADVGDGAAGDSAEIGSTSEALTSNANVTDFSLNARYAAASCVVSATRTINNQQVTRDMLLVVGGYPGSPTGLAFGDAVLYDAPSDTYLAADSLAGGEERGEAKLLALGSGKCLLAGGLSALSGGSARLNAFVFDASQAAGSQWVAAGTMNEGHAKFAMNKCGTGSQVAALGGHVAAGEASPVSAANSVEVWNGLTGGAATWTAQNKLNPQVSAFAFAVKDAQTTVGKWAVVGGESGAGLETEVQTFTSDGSCTFTKLATVADLRDDGNTANTRARVGSVAVFGSFDHDSDSNTESLYVTGGDDQTGTLPTDVQRYTVKYTGSAPLGSTFTAQHTGAGVSLPNGVRLANPVNFSANKLMLVGGELDDVTALLQATPADKAQVLDVSAASVTPAFSSVTLNQVYLGNAAEFFNSKVYVTTGLSAQDTTAPIVDTLHKKTQPVTP